MTIVQALFLGIIQGITEFLPISSSGHLIFLPSIFGWEDQGLAFDVVVHLGSLLAVIVFFRNKLWKILKGFFAQDDLQNRNLGLLLILSIIPAGIIGLFFGDFIETGFRSATVVGFGLIFWGVLLGLADKYSNKLQNPKNLEKANWKNALFIGCAQAIALIPGTSRSGITMTAGLFAKFDRKSAAEFSFLMSVPVIGLAGALKIFELLSFGLGQLSLEILSVGFIASALSGFIAISGLMKLIQRWSFMPFVYYRVVVGILILFLF